MDPASTPELSLVIPAYNEATRLPATIAAVQRYLDGLDVPAELVVVDDGSKDATASLICAAAARDPRVVPVVNPDNRGKGGAVKAGVAVSRGRVIAFTDADLSYALDNVAVARERIAAGADVVIGARDLGGSDSRSAYAPHRRVASRAFNGFVEAALRLGVTDTQCGFKAFRGDVARALFPTLTIAGFGFDVELLFVARRWELRIDRVPVAMLPRAGSTVNVVRHGFDMARDVLRIRANARRGIYPPRPSRL